MRPRPALKSFVRRALVAAALLSAAGIAAAADAPKTVRLLVGFPPGGGTDAIARLLADKLQTQLGGTTVIVENKPGAGGQLAAMALKSAPADGSTYFVSHDHTISVLPLVMKNPGYDPQKDFVPVAGFATFVNALALSGGTPAKTFNEYVDYLKRDKNGQGTIGVPAPASTPEFLVKLIGAQFGLDLQSAPYRGSAPMIGDMLGNQITAGIGSVPDFIENHKAGKLHVVGVLGGERQAALPDVPTFAELGMKGLEDEPYYGVFAPAGTPQLVIDRFAEALGKVIQLPDVRERLTALGLSVGYMSSEQLATRERAYAKTWAKIIKDSGFVLQ